MRRAEVFLFGRLAGLLTEDEQGYSFQYDEQYLQDNPVPVSVNLPLQKEAFREKMLFPFFDGLIPEGWLLSIASKNWKLDTRDRMGLLLACCSDCIGAASIREIV